MAQKMITGFTHKTTIRWGDTIRNPELKEGDMLMKFDTVVANPPLSLDKWGKVEDKEGQNNHFLWPWSAKFFESLKNQNKLRSKDIDLIVSTYRDFANGKDEPGIGREKYSYVAKLEEIRESEYNLNISCFPSTNWDK